MYILFFRCSFVQKKNKTWYFRPIFREKPLFPPGYIKSPANSKSQWCDLGEHWTLKSIVQKSSRIQRSLLKYSQQYLHVSLKSLWNPTYFLESCIYFGIPKKNRKWNPRIQFWNPIFFSVGILWNPTLYLGIPRNPDAFFWNPRAYIRPWFRELHFTSLCDCIPRLFLEREGLKLDRIA